MDAKKHLQPCKTSIQEEYKIKLLLEDMGSFLAKFTENSEHVYWISSPELQSIEYVSPSYERIWGRSREDLYANPESWITFLHPDDAIHHHPIHEMAEKIKSLSDKARYSENYRIIRPDGEVRWIIDRGFPIYDEHNQCIGVTGIAIDITEQKKSEIALTLAKEKAEAANRAKTDFIANMSHDIRTPLSGVVGMAALLKESATTVTQQTYAQYIIDSGNQLLNLLNEILDVITAANANEHDVRKDVVDLRQCIDELIQLEKPSTMIKGLQLFANVDKLVPPYVTCDRTKLHRILLNLISNAIKFTDHGFVSIDVLFISAKANALVLQFRVTDTGIGIPNTLQHQVFERFFKASPSYKGRYEGHGLGLRIAQSYANLLGSDIKLSSQEGDGTTFYFDLTLEEASAPVQDITPPVHELIPYPLTRIPQLLLVEDNEIALRMVELIARKAGCQFHSCSNGEDALELAQTHAFDLIITDIGLPGISGVDFTCMLREWESRINRPPVPIIGLTAHGKTESETIWNQAGMNEVLRKPIDIMTMQRIVNQFASRTSCSQENLSSILGTDLPNDESLLFQLQAYPLFDKKQALENIGSDALLDELLAFLINTDLPHERAAMQSAYEQQDWERIEKLAHKIKGGAVYIGTVRLKMACQYLERYRKAGYRSLLPRLFEQLMAVIDDTKQAIA